MARLKKFHMRYFHHFFDSLSAGNTTVIRHVLVPEVDAFHVLVVVGYCGRLGGSESSTRVISTTSFPCTCCARLQPSAWRQQCHPVWFVDNTATWCLSCHIVSNRFPDWRVSNSPGIFSFVFFTSAGSFQFIRTVPHAGVRCRASSWTNGTEVNKLSSTHNNNNMTGDDGLNHHLGEACQRSMMKGQVHFQRTRRYAHVPLITCEFHHDSRAKSPRWDG